MRISCHINMHNPLEVTEISMIACVPGLNSKDIRMLHANCLAQIRVSKSTHLMAKTLAKHGLMTQADALSKDTRCLVNVFPCEQF